ncbi:DNA mismatch repair protein MutS, partial [Atlantibacter subterraneus]|uniref:DNA mismatch repair protein MutS n=1 Tax=Atlantibacter subterraneus TaxID=255519 RepID=UPI002FDCFB9B
PATTKGPVERKVVRIVTPGTISDEALLQERQDNLLAALWQDSKGFGYATLDISSGRFRLSEPQDRETMAAELQRTNPAELLYAEDFAEKSLIEGRRGLRRRPLWEFEIDTARQQLNMQFGTRDLIGFGVENAPRGLCAAGCLLQYVKDTQRTTLPHIRSITMERQQDSIIMDAATRRNLEITQNLSGGVENTLASVLDGTVTPMGSRMLKRWLHMPVRNHETLRSRQQTIAALMDSTSELQPVLRQVGDLERILARLALRTARPRDLARMRHAFQQLPLLNELLGEIDSEYVQTLRQNMGEFSELRALLERAIIDSPPVLIRDGGVIAPGYHEELDEWRALADGATDYLDRLEIREREKLGLDTLKVGFNAVHGYYIQVSRGQSHLVPMNYVRRQTLKNAERYIIPELKEYEDKVLTSKGKALSLEKQLYDQLFDMLLPHLAELQQSATTLAELDVLVNLAERALTLNYCCPTLSDKPGINIVEGRHPVVERVLNEPFIANPLALSTQRRMLIITGPNMGGKSTYMRQTALIVLMAYIGSFVPATQAEIGPVDRIFTRVGAADDLASGRSTFMVEMTETANILHNATEHSLVLMDEIGRGTSTYDGLSLAWACAENLANRIKAFTLFATHYFELTTLPEKMEGVANVHLDAIEHGDTIAFMHSVQDGAASKSYGLAVAALAGVPKEVIKRARQKLRELENLSGNASATQIDGTQMSLLAAAEETSPAVEALEALDPDSLSPRQALEWIYRLKNLV